MKLFNTKYLLRKTTKILMQGRCIWTKIICIKYISFMLYVTVLIRHIVNFLFIQRITMLTQIITLFTQYFKEYQPFLLTFITWFSKNWHRLNESICEGVPYKRKNLLLLIWGVVLMVVSYYISSEEVTPCIMTLQLYFV